MACPSGTYSDILGASSPTTTCQPCPENFYCYLRGKTSLFYTSGEYYACGDGYVCTGGARMQSPFEATYGGDLCPIGHYCNSSLGAV